MTVAIVHALEMVDVENRKPVFKGCGTCKAAMRQTQGFDVTITEAGKSILTMIDGKAMPVTVEEYKEKLSAQLVNQAPTLDVFRTEPLPPEHLFWRHPKITLTPHTSARTLREESIAQIAGKILALERGFSVAGIVDPVRGY